MLNNKKERRGVSCFDVREGASGTERDKWETENLLVVKEIRVMKRGKERARERVGDGRDKILA